MALFRADTLKRLAAVLNWHVESEHRVTIHEQTHLEKDLQLDSVDRVSLLMELEDEFDIAITDAEAEEWKTAGDIVNFLIENAD